MVSHSFEVAGERFAIRSTSEAVGSWLEEALSAYRIDTEEEPKFSLVVAENAAGSPARSYHILYTKTWQAVRTLHLPTLGRALLGELELFSSLERTDTIILDVLTVRLGDRLGLIPALLGPTLQERARQLARSGVQVPVDMWTAVDLETGDLVPASSGLKLNPDPLGGLEELDGSSSSPDRFVPDHGRADVVGTWDSATGKSFETISPAMTLRNIAAHALNLDVIGGRALGPLKALVAGASVHHGIVPVRDVQITEWLMELARS